MADSLTICAILNEQTVEKQSLTVGVEKLLSYTPQDDELDL